MFAGTTWCVAAPIANYDCTYSAKAGSDVLHVEHCAWSDAAGHIRLKRKYLLALDFDQHGLASINIAGEWYYLQRDGRLAPVMAMDNWAEPFADELLRGLRSAARSVSSTAIWRWLFRLDTMARCRFRMAGRKYVSVAS